jgi:hypothetical protein
MDMPFNKKRKIEENVQEVPQEVPELSEAIGGKTDLINSCLPGGGASGGGRQPSLQKFYHLSYPQVVN